MTVTDSGLVTGTGASVTTLDSFFLQNGGGPVNLGGSLTTNNGNITFDGQATVLVPITFNTGSGTGNVTFNNTLDGDSNVIINAGLGNIAFNAPVGGSVPLDELTINSANNISANAINTGTLSASSVAGAATFSGAISTTDAGGITLSGNGFALNNNVTTTNTGSVSITNTGPLGISNSSILSIDGGFTQTGNGTINYGHRSRRIVSRSPSLDQSISQAVLP